MKLPVTVHHARLGATEFRVIRPATPLTRAVLVDLDWWLNMYVDQDAARRIGWLWLLAARSARTLIHLPLRANTQPTSAWAPGARPGPKLDLVLVHHSLQFPPAQWKRLRARLGPGRPHNVRLPEANQADEWVIDPTRYYREHRDRFHQHLHAETLFMTGSAKVFRDTARNFLSVARNGPRFAAAGPLYTHYCSEFHSNDGTLGKAREIHVEYCHPPQWR